MGTIFGDRRILHAIAASRGLIVNRSPIGRKALGTARRLVGTTEDPPGSNRTSFGRWFGVDGVPWCNIFVSFCFVNGAKYTICSGFKGAGVYAKGCTYVPTTEAWLHATGMWKGRTQPMPGDIAIYNWNGGVADHIGIVEEYLGGGRFNAIEGNTAVGNDANGGEVMRRLRYMTDVNGFRALVHRHRALDAPEMAHHHDAVGALRARVPLRQIDHVGRVALHVEQRLARRLARLVELLQLVMVEPDPAAAAVADVDGDVAGGARAEGVAARGAVHEADIGTNGPRLKRSATVVGSGGVPERSNGPVLKTGGRVSVP